ncbi:MAG: hypothetical protein U0990_05145 [Candidatus Nanopelagicales bacterium]|nr:hypothetical protein [Candidatus Nanopelagicales bacterium]MDZ4249460.1 hypothetical protein [Candidatus Nanopelagicales bacterium]
MTDDELIDCGTPVQNVQATIARVLADGEVSKSSEQVTTILRAASSGERTRKVLDRGDS